MRGYEVVTSDDRRVGNVVDVRDGYLIVSRAGCASRGTRCPASSSTSSTGGEGVRDGAPPRADGRPRGRPQGAVRPAQGGLALRARRVLRRADDEGAARRSATIRPGDRSADGAARASRAEIRKHCGRVPDERRPSTTLFGDRRIDRRPAQTQARQGELAEPCSAIRSRIASRSTRSSSQESVTMPIRLAFAASRPSSLSSAPPGG